MDFRENAAGPWQTGLPIVDEFTEFASWSNTWNNYADLSIDQTPNGNNLTDAGTYAHSVALPAGITTEGTTELLVSVRSGITNAYGLVLRSPDTVIRVRMLVGNGNNSFQAGVSVGNTIPIPNLAAGYRTYYWAWVTMPNPATTGPADALLNIHHVWDVATGQYATAGGVNAVVPATDQVVIGASSPAGANLFATANNGRVGYSRISRTARSRTALRATLPAILAVTPP